MGCRSPIPAVRRCAPLRMHRWGWMRKRPGARPAPADGALPSSGGTRRVPRCAGSCGGFFAVLDLEGGIWKIYRPRRHRLSQSVALYSGRPCRVSGWVGPLVSNLDSGGADDLPFAAPRRRHRCCIQPFAQRNKRKKTAKIRKFLLTRSFVCDRIVLTCEKGLIFVRLFQPRAVLCLDWDRFLNFLLAGAIQGGKYFKEVPIMRVKSHFEMLRVQAEKLQHHEEQEERP